MLSRFRERLRSAANPKLSKMRVLCSLTGASDDVDPYDLIELSAEFPWVEWAVLYSTSRSAVSPRYPTIEWIDLFREKLHPLNVNTALHLCGSAVMDFLAIPTSEARRLAEGFGRIQLNFNQASKPVDLNVLAMAIRESDCPIITQHTRDNAVISDFIRLPMHHVLFDESGGRGVSPQGWPAPMLGKGLCGYAGGIGPDNVEKEIRRIAQVCGHSAWYIDMESSLRDASDRFDLSKCRRVLETVEAYRDFMVEATA